MKETWSSPGGLVVPAPPSPAALLALLVALVAATVAAPLAAPRPLVVVLGTATGPGPGLGPRRAASPPRAGLAAVVVLVGARLRGDKQTKRPLDFERLANALRYFTQLTQNKSTNVRPSFRMRCACEMGDKHIR